MRILEKKSSRKIKYFMCAIRIESLSHSIGCCYFGWSFIIGFSLKHVVSIHAFVTNSQTNQSDTHAQQ